MLQFISNKETMVIYKNFKFTRHRKNKNSANYWCTTDACKASITIQNLVIDEVQPVHIHDPMSDCEMTYLIEATELKERLEKTPDIDAKKCYESILQKLKNKFDNTEIAVVYKPWEKVKVTFWHHSKLSKPIIKPETDFTETLPKLVDGEVFAKYDNKSRDNRIIIMVSNNACKIIAKSEQWHFDGTFKAVPKMFTQQLNVSCYHKNITLRCAFILLQRKERQTYIEAIGKLKEIILIENKLEISIKTIVTDFEYGLQQAIHCIFDKAQIKGCWFHFNQAIMKKISNLGLRSLYCQNHNFKLWVKRFGALALIPLDSLQRAWDIILDTMPESTNVSAFFKFLVYFAKNWILGKHGQNKLPIIWNFYDHDGPRTNNNLEGFHSITNKRLPPHPNVYQLVEYLKTVDSASVDTYEKILQGRLLKKDKRFESNEQELAIIQEEYRRKLVSFDDYFYKITHHVVYSKYIEVDETTNGEIVHETDESIEKIDYDSVYKQSDQKIESIENIFETVDLFRRVDLINESIQPKAQSLFSDEQFLILKSQVECFKNYVEHLTSATKIFEYATKVATKKAMIPLLPINSLPLKKRPERPKQPKRPKRPKRNQATDNEDIVYEGICENVSYKRKQVCMDYLLLNDSEWLDDLHIDAYQNLLSSRFRYISGLFHPNRFLDSEFCNSIWNPDTIHDSQFIQVLHAEDHWVTITNYNPWYCPEQPFGVWFIYDSLNRPRHYLNKIKPALKRLCGSNHLTVVHSEVVQQRGASDCGLFALAYATALAENINPSILAFEQSRMRNEYNNCIRYNNVTMFSNNLLNNNVNYVF